MSNIKVMQQLQRKALLVNIFEKLAILFDDDLKEFDSLIERIKRRIEHYEKSIEMPNRKA